jgi:non-ribosomal peptide synthetase component F
MQINERRTLSHKNDNGRVTDDGTAHHNYAHQMVSAIAAKYPTAAAIVAGSKVLSYGELDSLANKLAWQLRSMGIVPEDVVALWMTRSPWLIVSALAVLKTGAADGSVQSSRTASVHGQRFRRKGCDFRFSFDGMREPGRLRGIEYR